MRTSAEQKNENGSRHLHNGAFETVSVSSYAVTTYLYTHVVYVSAENYCVWNRHTDSFRRYTNETRRFRVVVVDSQ